MKKDGIEIIKASGEKELFSEEKLRASLTRAGTATDVIDTVIERVMGEMKDGMTTREIYKRAFSLIKKDKAVAVRYSLRQAVMNLGPTGFPFEKFLGEVMKTQGFDVKTGITLPGYCVEHEVDVLASRDDKHIFVEAKFHNNLGIKTDLKVALYVKARFDDLRKEHNERSGGVSPKIHEGWLVTNTKLTSKAKAYGRCAGLRVIGWNYPKNGNLQDMILEAKAHPISCLTTINSSKRNLLIDKDIILCKDLSKQIGALKKIGMSDDEVSKVSEEIGILCG